MIFGALCLLALASADAASFGSGASAGAVSSASSFGGANGQAVNYGTSGYTNDQGQGQRQGQGVSYGTSSGYTNGRGQGPNYGTSGSYTNGQGQGVNYGTTSGYSGSGTYSPGFPYTPITTQQYSTQSYPNSNYPNNYRYNNYQSQHYPNQFQYQNPFQAQFQNQIQQQQQLQQFPFVPFPTFQFAPFFPPPFSPPEYQQAFAQFQNSLQQQIASGASFAHSTPGSTAYALSSLGPTNLYNQQQEAWNQWQNGGGGVNSVPYYAPNYAAASGSYGPNGIHQTASIYPPNPNSPNIDNRFGASEPNDGNGFFGISTSSFSTSSDVNGVKTNRKGAITSVNDNGKITTYKVGS